MIHEFEEIIFIKLWFNMNKDKIKNKFPQIAHRITDHLEKMSTEGFSIAVLEEFLLIIIITVTAAYYKFYLIWFGIVVAFTVHLLIHCIQTIVFRGYVVAAGTSTFGLPICIWIIYRAWLNVNYPIENIITVCAIVLILMSINLLFIHKMMEKFEDWKIEKLCTVKKIKQ